MEVAGSFALNVFQRQHEDMLGFKLPTWFYGGLDIFVTDRDFHGLLLDFEQKLALHGHTVLKRVVKRFKKASGVRSLDHLIIWLAL